MIIFLYVPHPLSVYYMCITVQVPGNVDKLVKLVLTDPLGLSLGG